MARGSKRSKSFLAAEAIAAYVESEEWQVGEMRAAMQELDASRGVSDKVVAEWLGTWGSQAKR